MTRLIQLLLLIFSQLVSAADKAPNIVIILADDLGWNDVGYHGSEIRTPALDALASQGVVLNHFYTQPICSPTRAALMTGKSPQRMGVYRQFAKNAEGGLPVEEKTLADYLKAQGYQTWLVGKWHLGHAKRAFHPNARGFDHFYGHVTGGIGFWDKVHGGGYDWQRNGETVREEGYSTHLLAEEAAQLIRKSERGKPFFLFASFNAPHLPNEAPAASVEAYADIPDPFRRVHAAMVTELDTAVHRIVERLDETGELDNTLIWFLSDNGGLNRNAGKNAESTAAVMETLQDWFGAPLPIRMLEFVRTNSLEGGSDNAPFRYGKTSVYEGGVRVPSFVYWPNQLDASKSEAFITVEDVLPTLLAAIDVEVTDEFDGTSQLNALVGRQTSQTNDYVTLGQFGDQAYYQWPWKMISDDGVKELYHLIDDPTETRDLASLHPERMVEMQQLLDDLPRGASVHIPTYRVLMDPDFFGGEEDREPWAEQMETQYD